MLDKDKIQEWWDKYHFIFKQLMGIPEYEVTIHIVPASELELNKKKRDSEGSGQYEAECERDPEYLQISIWIDENITYADFLKDIVHECAHLIHIPFERTMFTIIDSLPKNKQDTAINMMQIKTLKENVAVKIERMVGYLLNPELADYRDLWDITKLDDEPDNEDYDSCT